jgi:hypothetical protein
MKIQAFLVELNGDKRELSLGFYGAESLWGAREKAKRKHSRFLERLQTGAFEVVCRPATDAEIVAPKPRPRDTTRDIWDDHQ